MGMVEDFKVNVSGKEINVKAPNLDLDSNIREIAEYLGKSSEELKKELEAVSEKFGGFGKYVKVTEEEWNSKKIDQENAQEVLSFYAQTKNYIPELMIISASEDKQRLRRFVAAYCLKERIKKILDFGSGSGEDSIIASLNGMDASAADVEGKTFDFAKWRFKKYGVNVKTISVKDDKPLSEKYDAITCFEVLNHVPNPERVLKHFHDSLKERGLLFITSRFKGNYSLSLKKNEKYHEIFDDFVKSKGFELINKVHMWGPKDNSGKWLYVFRKN